MTSMTLEEWDHWQALPLQGRQAAHRGRRRRTRKPQLAKISDSWEEDFSGGGSRRGFLQKRIFSLVWKMPYVYQERASEFSRTLVRVLVSSWIPELWRAVGSRRTGFKKDSHPIPLLAPRHGQLWKKHRKSAKLPWHHNNNLSYWSLSFLIKCLKGLKGNS